MRQATILFLNNKISVIFKEVNRAPKFRPQSARSNVSGDALYRTNVRKSVDLLVRLFYNYIKEFRMFLQIGGLSDG